MLAKIATESSKIQCSGRQIATFVSDPEVSGRLQPAPAQINLPNAEFPAALDYLDGDSPIARR